MNRLLGLLRALGGVIPVIAGAVAYVIILWIAGAKHVVDAKDLAFWSAVASGFAGWWVDVRFSITERLHNKMWTDEITAARKGLRNDGLDVRSALLKTIAARHELARAPGIKHALFTPKELKQVRKQQVFIAEHVIPLIAARAVNTDRKDLDAWLAILGEAEAILVMVEYESSLLRRWFSRNAIAQEVAQRWTQGVGAPLIPQPPSPALPPRNPIPDIVRGDSRPRVTDEITQPANHHQHEPK